jgi:titin
MRIVMPSRRTRFLALLASAAAIGALLVASPQAAVAGPTVVTQTFSYTGSTSSFTVPANITSLTVTITGGEGGNGGADATPAPPAGGYRGVVTGTLAVTPGQTLTVAVGGGGATGASQRNSNNASAATGGTNPLGSYNGGTGGKAGANGSSGFGGAGGAASVLRVNGTDVVGAGGGGNGGSGQYASTRGRTATSSYSPRTDSTTTNGQVGLNANDVCSATNCSNNDGGGGGAGGGGAQGGAQGALEFGAGSSNEWFGYAGSVGQNSTGAFSGLTSSYQYYSDNGANGSITIAYTTGSPAAPTAVTGTAGNGSVSLLWTAPTDPGQTAISDYVVQYSSNGGTSWSSAVDLGSTATSGTVTGLSNGTAYIFQVAAVNSIGTGTWSSSSASITPQGPPSAPTISSVVAQDGALQLGLTAPTSGATVTSYDYRLNGGAWVNVASASTTLVIPGLLNGTSYTVEVRGESAVGAGTVSSPAVGAPQAVPGAPTISSLSAGARSLTIGFTTGFTGGGTITSYQYTLDGGTTWVTASATTSPITITGLADGTGYSVQLRAVNGSGAGAASAPASATTPAVPGAPSVSSVTAGDGRATVVFTPGSTGGTPIDHYEYQLGSTGNWTTASASSSPLTITGLTNGTPVDVRIRAVNSVGAGTASASTTVTPATVPGAPSIIGNTVAGSDATLTAAFTAPGSDGGSSITSYQYSTDAGATWRDRTDGGTTASPLVITVRSSDGTTPLVNGVTYLVELRAVNSVGFGTASAVASGIATTSPSAPTVTTVAAQPQALRVVFTAGSNGGSSITAYEYTVDGGAHWTSTGTLGTSFTIGGLQNGQSYPVQLRAINAVGTGSASAPVSGTPVDLPGRPSITSVVRSNQTLTASVSLADNGGSAVTSWQYSTDGGASWATSASPSSPLIITTLSSDGSTRLSNGTGYSVAVRAVTTIGTGAASATTTVAPATAPASPSIALTPGNGSISVAFTLGVDGGSPVSSIEFSLDGGTTWTSSGTLSSPFTISGLNNGTAYAVQVRADNAIGNGSPSLTASTTPRTVPGAPSAVSAVSNSASADVAWSAPSSTGGAAISSYTASAYTASAGGSAVSSCTTSSTACSIPSLSNGTAYYVAVTASNVAGAGSASSPRVLVTPLARPAAPTLNSLTASDGSLSINFTAGSAGDRSITGYQYSIDGGSTWQNASGTSSPILVTGFTNGTGYSMVLRAVSSAGAGATSNSLSATPYTYPSAPDASTIIANGGNGQITVSWAAANLNGGTLLNYTATAFSALTSGSTVQTCTTTTLSCTLTGLSNGTTYYISLQTQNTANMFSVRSTPRVPGTPSLTPGSTGTPVAVAGNAQATVSWTAPTSTGASGITGYTIKCSANGGGFTQCATPGASATSATITGLTNGSAYTFVVTAVNSNGTGIASAPSNSVTPLAPGTAPTFGSVTSTATGFTSSIANFDSGANYTATATNGATVMLSGSTVTVTGLSNGASSTVTVTVTKSGQTTVNSNVTGAALLTGVAPTFSGVTRTSTGFSFTITNLDPNASYSFSASNGATATLSGATVTVTGLALGGSSSVSVTVSKSGSTDATNTASGVALLAGTAPTFTAVTSTDSGFTFTISNYSASLSYTLTATGDATVTRSGAAVTVTGLTNGASSVVTVSVGASTSTTSASATQSGSALLTGTAPVLASAVSTGTGFTSSITNYDAGTSYAATATNGATVTLSGATVTVTGLSNGAAATVTVSATKSGQTTVSAAVAGAALLMGTAPTFSAGSASTTGFSFTITNYDGSAGYSFTTTNGGTATRAGAVVTVTGLGIGGSASVTVTVSKSGYTDATAVKAGVALVAGTAPTFSDRVSTDTGFRFTIANYDPSLSYAFSATGSATVIRSGAIVTVTGLSNGASADVTVVASDPGVSIAAASESGAALLSGTAPTVSAVSVTADGYTFTITNLDADAAYTVSSTAGTVNITGNMVTVSGLLPGQGADVTVVNTKAGFVTTQTTVTAAALLTGITPLFSAPTPTADGFTFAVSNFDPAASYTVSTSAGTATIVAGLVAVTGLLPSGSADVTVTVAHDGYTSASASQTATALAAGVAPVLSSVVATEDGFTFVISNYDPTLVYTATVSPAGVIAIHSDGTATVSGISSGTLATATVTSTTPGVSTAAATTSATTLIPTDAPVLTTAIAQSGGYSFTISNYDASQSYTFVESHGGTVTRTGDSVSVTGLAAGLYSETVVTATSVGHGTASATAGATTFPDGSSPVAGAVTRTVDGFRFALQLDGTSSYSVTSDAGTVVLLGSTVTVAGLAPGQTTVVHVTASAPGTVDSTIDVAGTAIAAGIAPTFATPIPVSGGFTVTISNFTSAAGYALATSSGTVTRNGATVTVAGLGSGRSATVAVTVTRSGYTAASASVSGTAVTVAPPAPAPTSAPTTTPITPPAPTVTSGAVPTENSSTSGAHSSAPSVADSAPGAGVILSAGAPVETKVTTRGRTVTVSDGSALRLTVSAQKDGVSQPLAADGVVVVDRDGRLWITAAGLSPSSIVTVWSTSESGQLATARADGSGATAQAVSLPSTLKPGTHTIVVQGVDAAGKPVTLQLGIRVLDAQSVSTVSPTGAPAATEGLALALVLAILVIVGWWFFLARRRRRRDDEEITMA